MSTKRISEKFKDLKVGDLVTIYKQYDRRFEPIEETVEKTGSKYIYAGGSKYNREKGYGDYGYELFPGSLQEYKSYLLTQEVAYKLLERLKSTIYDLTREELESINNILNKK